jgi:hypothetical protein
VTLEHPAALLGHHAGPDPSAEGPRRRLADHRIIVAGRGRELCERRRIGPVAQRDRGGPEQARPFGPLDGRTLEPRAKRRVVEGEQAGERERRLAAAWLKPWLI